MRVLKRGKTIFVRIPLEWQRAIPWGTCECPYCVAHPNNAPMWDTLSIDATGKFKEAGIVHYPDF